LSHGLEVLIERLGVSISQDLLTQALTHRSHSYENGNQPNNERLEFLGDSVLGFVVTAELYKRFGELQEGELSSLKNSVVSAKALAEVAAGIDIGAFLLLGKGEEKTGGRDKGNLLADAFEAILGAIYIEHGLSRASDLVERFIFPLLDNHTDLLLNSEPKTKLQEIAQERGLAAPVYETTHTGPDHDRIFSASVTVGDVVAAGEARSRKGAESEAAIAAIKALGGN
jgi:ribonuclease III